MSTRLLVNARTGDAPTAISESGVEVLAEYPDTVLVRGTDEQVAALQQAGVEATPLPEQPVQVAGNSFAFADAVLAQDTAEVAPSPDRTAYYLLKLVGPPAPEWLDQLREHGAEVHDSLANFTLLVGVRPEQVARLRDLPWVDDITPYRPAMKLSPRLRGERRRSLDVGELAVPTGVPDGPADSDARLVEVSVFPGESAEELAGRIRAEHGSVVSVSGRALVASVRTEDLARLATQEGVQAILPHELPEWHNDKAAAVMGVPSGHTFAGTALAGAGQLVGIADSGLDTGDPATVHADVRGRVAGIVSWPARQELADLLQVPPGDDGPVDRNSGHGTHVTGSVLGNGAAAVALGADMVPAGTAPAAEVFFQAIEQEVRWKSADELRAAGIPVPQGWPPPAISLWGLPADLGELFAQAYDAGVRVHTNSWGAAVAGDYNDNARAVDEFMWTHPDILIVFSAGNSGEDKGGDGLIDLDSVGSPGTAKNCLTVGASENDRPHGSTPAPGVDADWNQLRWPTLAAAGHVSDDVDGMAAFSSRGPVDGERTKPDVVAPGTNIASTLSSRFPADKTPLWGRLPAGHPLRDLYCWSGGTSMATPLVAGTAVIVRQHLVEQRGHATPSGALIKAFLVNGAVPMTGQFPGEVPGGPNNVSGFGRVNLARSVNPGPRQEMLFVQEPGEAVATGEMRRYRIESVDPAAPLNVTLAWTDAPSAMGNGGLTNQLYLQLETPDGTVLDGDLTPFPTATNNVQRITIAAPATGTYVVRVRGVSVILDSPGAAPTGLLRQDFALTADNGTGLTRAE